jgi:hypothetical protein
VGWQSRTDGLMSGSLSLTDERKSKMKIKIRNRIKRKSTIYFAALPLSYSRVEFLLISPMSIRTIL